MAERCLRCGEPIAAHRVVEERGIAHTALPGRISCSALDTDISYQLGRASELTRLARSLNWHAGRARTQGQFDTAVALRALAARCKHEAEQAQAMIAHWKQLPQ